MLRLLSIAMLIWSSLAWARFQHTDADEIDSDGKLDTEYFLTLRAYRPPSFWNGRWQNSLNGLRLTTGSLGVDRSFLKEEIKAGVSGPIRIGVRHERQEDLVEQTVQREVQLGISPLFFLELSALADGGTFKQWADVGGRLRLGVRRLHLSGEVWWVDHFFNQKNPDEDSYVIKPTTQSLKAVVNTLYGALDIEAFKDSPLELNRDSLGYRYKYSKEGTKASLRLGLPHFLRITAKYNHEAKVEEKVSFVSGVEDGRKGLDRSHEEQSGAIEFGPISNHMRIGYFVLERLSLINFSAEQEIAPSVGDDENSLIRKESGAFTTFHHSFFESTNVYLQWGLYVSEVTIKSAPSSQQISPETEFETEDQGTPRHEGLFQLAFSLRFATARLFFNTIYDLDHFQAQPFSGSHVSLQTSF